METNIKNVGNTPLVRLEETESLYGVNVRLYGKDESQNPTGSVKDRAVKQMLLDDVKSGRITKETTVIEATSGNVGIALAAFGKAYAKEIVIVMPSSMSVERRRLILSYGAKLELVQGGMKEAEDRAIELQKEIPNSVIFGQFSHPSNPKAHYLTTAPEIVKQLPNVKYIFSAFGSAGTLSGIGKYVKDNNLDIKVIGIEPKQSPLITKGVAGKHLIQGIGANFVPETLQMDYVDEIITVDDMSSIQVAKMVNKYEEVYIGYSSGAAILGAINYMKEHNIENVDVAVIMPDSGGRYTWKN